MVVTSLSFYAIFLLIQTTRHSQYFLESQDVRMAADSSHHQMHSSIYHTVMLFLYLIVVILLAEKFAIPDDHYNKVYQKWEQKREGALRGRG